MICLILNEFRQERYICKRECKLSKPRKRDLSTIGAACKGAQWQMHTHKSM